MIGEGGGFWVVTAACTAFPAEILDYADLIKVILQLSGLQAWDRNVDRLRLKNLVKTCISGLFSSLN